MLLTGKKKECRLLSVMPADGIVAAAQKGGLRHVLLAARGHSMSVHTTYNVSQVVGRAALRCAYGAPWKKSALGRGAPRRGAAGAGRGDRVQTVADDLSGSAASCCARYTIVEY